MPERPPPPESCANCGAALPRQARACPECGADERTGWREQSIYDGLDLPASAWHADDHDDSNGGEGRRPAPANVGGVPWYWWVAGVALVVALISAVVGLR